MKFSITLFKQTFTGCAKMANQISYGKKLLFAAVANSISFHLAIDDFP